jgi:hypothetical protein
VCHGRWRIGSAARNAGGESGLGFGYKSTLVSDLEILWLVSGKKLKISVRDDNRVFQGGRIEGRLQRRRSRDLTGVATGWASEKDPAKGAMV